MYYLDWSFVPSFDAIDPASAYHGLYAPGLVAASLAIAILAAFVALSISGRIVAARTGRERLAWSAAGAISMGGGIWSMHFIGMLAFSLPCGISYDPVGTILSMVPGALASGIALAVISRRAAPDLKRLLFGAVLMGAGIGAMHYSGMAAMRPEALLLYDPALVAISVVVAVALAFISLSIRFQLAHSASFWPTSAAASVMGCAVAGMHYTAMQAAIFFPLPDASIWSMALPKTMLALGIVTVTVLVAISTLVASFAGRQTELAQVLRGEVARREELERDAESGRARLQAILDGVVDGVVTFDGSCRIRQWSSGAQRIFGYSADEVLGADLMILMPEPHRWRHHLGVTSFLTEGTATIVGIGREFAAIRKDGTEFSMEFAVNEVRTKDEVLFTGILRDITERKRNEAALIEARQQAEAANLFKTQFLARMSHELRTPLNAVIGYSEMLLEDATAAGRAEQIIDLQRIHIAGRHLQSLVNDVLDISKIEAGKMELDVMPFDLGGLINDVVATCEPLVLQNGNKFMVECGLGLGTAIGDATKLRQVVLNLISNAAKFTENGHITLTVKRDTRPAGDWICLAVRDTGIGISREDLSKLFNEFSQVNTAITNKYGGTGLGLALSQKLCRTMGGEIAVESEPGQGACFSIRLPAVLSPPGQAAAA